MSKRLVLLRHAKSSWAEALPDHDRPLAERGRKAAPVMARFLAGRGIRPDLVLVSSAVRTQETWALMAPALETGIRRDEERLYEAPAEQLLALLQETSDAVGTLMVIGHNPGLEELARMLIKDGDAAAIARLYEKFPTAAVALLDIPVASWKDLAPQSARLVLFETPKSVR
jgi:phosphohistidine phosphatase